MKKTENHKQRILIFCKDWDYIQYFTSLLSKCCPDAILRISSSSKAMVQTAASEAFDTIIFDMQESIQNRKEILEKIASLKSSPKVIVWEGEQQKIADIKSGANKPIRRPRRQAEILQFIRQSI